MEASDAYNIYEESQISGLAMVLKQIRLSAKDGPQLEVTLRRKDISQSVINALRRRKFHVTIKDFDKTAEPQITISWDPAKTEK